MKRTPAFRRMICLLLILCAFAAVIPASAGAAGEVICLSCDKCIPGNHYVLMLLKSGTDLASISDSDLLFIDQCTAEGTDLEIALIYPDCDACDAVIGGTFDDGSASPRKLGSYQAARMPGLLQTIEEEAFAGAGFTHVFIGEQVSSIGKRAFAECANLSYVYIPPSVRSIADDAFPENDALVIGCRQDTYACQYAEENGFRYILVD